MKENKKDKKSLFFAVLGNPPYQGDNHQQLYPFFYNGAKGIAECIDMIFPTGWQGPKNANNLRQMNTAEVKEDHQIIFIDNRQNMFRGVAGAEWTNIILWKNGYNNGLSGKQRILTNGQNAEIKKLIVDKKNIEKPDEIVALKDIVISRPDFKPVSEITSVLKPYGLRTDFLDNPGKYGLPNTIYETRQHDDDIKIYGTKCVKYLPNNYPFPKNENMITKYKVFLPYAWGGMEEGKQYLGGSYAGIIVGLPQEVCTETYLESGCFESHLLASIHAKYLLSKFTRALLFFNKYSRHSTTAWGAVPQQDYSEPWWDESIEQIDEHLFEKYGLPEDIREFVRKNIQPRTEANIVNFMKVET